MYKVVSVMMIVGEQTDFGHEQVRKCKAHLVVSILLYGLCFCHQSLSCYTLLSQFGQHFLQIGISFWDSYKEVIEAIHCPLKSNAAKPILQFTDKFRSPKITLFLVKPFRFINPRVVEHIGPPDRTTSCSAVDR